MRAKTIIIHGFQESSGANEEKEADSKRILQLTDILEVDVKPQLIIRLGKREKNKSRPIKIRMHTIDHKYQIMNSLSKLKQAPECFNSISVTDDYTLEERQTINGKVMVAKNKTEKEGEGQYVWKVRGTPKNGMELRRFVSKTSL